MMELSRMPVELLNEIFEQLYDDALSNLIRAALVSRRFYNIVTPLIYRSIQIDISGSTYSNSRTEDRRAAKRPLSTLVARLSASPSVSALIKNIHVFGRMGVHPPTLELLLSWLPKFSQLVSFSWDGDGCFPKILLKRLCQHWPNIHLHMRTAIFIGDIRKDWKVLTLAPTMLRSLQVSIPRIGEKGRRIAKEKLFWALKKCPGLQSLSTYDHQGYMDKFHRNHYGPSGRWHDVRFECPLPQLLELSIADKTFKVDDLLTWGAKEGWKKLRKITLWDDGLLYGFHGCEQSLRAINLIDAKPGYENALVEICSRTVRLTELKIQTEDSRLPFSALEICGHSLITLEVHTRRDFKDYWLNMQDIPVAFLQAIQRLCPGLTNLASNLRWPPDSSDHLSALSQISQLTKITLRIQEPPRYYKDKSSLAAVEYAFRHVIEHGSTEHNLKSLTLHEGAQPSDWDNPWGATAPSSRIFRATRSRNGGEKDQKINARQIRGPSETHLEQYRRQQEREEAEKTTRDYLDAMPPVVLSQMIEANSRQIRGTSPDIKGYNYEIQTGGWSPKLAEYEEKWKESNGILPMLEWQLQKRKEQGWKLWDMPLMKSEAGSEGFLYDRMIEASAEN